MRHLHDASVYAERDGNNKAATGSLLVLLVGTRLGLLRLELGINVKLVFNLLGLVMIIINHVLLMEVHETSNQGKKPDFDCAGQ